MDINLADSLFLAAILALLMINYSARRTATAQASRMLVKDRLEDLLHSKQGKTMKVLKARLSLQSAMLTFSATGALFAVLSSGMVVFELDLVAKIAFVVALACGAISLMQSLREISIANKSHFGELDDTISKDDPYHQSAP